MALRYVLDEHMRGVLPLAVQMHNARGVDPIDVVSVGDPADLPLGSPDPVILVWAEREGRVVVTLDRKIMATHLANHLRAGRRSPGVIQVRYGYSVTQVVDALVLHAHAGDPATYQDRIEFIP